MSFGTLLLLRFAGLISGHFFVTAGLVFETLLMVGWVVFFIAVGFVVEDVVGSK